jgi:hypothetical protein
MQVLQNMFSQFMSTFHFENVQSSLQVNSEKLPMKQHTILQVSQSNIEVSESMLSIEDLLAQVKEWRSTLEYAQDVSRLQVDNTTTFDEGFSDAPVLNPTVELPAGKFSDLSLSSSVFELPVCEQSDISTLNFCQSLHPQHQYEFYLPLTSIKQLLSIECRNLLELVASNGCIHKDKTPPTDLNYLKFQFTMRENAPVNSEQWVTDGSVDNNFLVLMTEVINIYFLVSRVKLKM